LAVEIGIDPRSAELASGWRDPGSASIHQLTCARCAGEHLGAPVISAKLRDLFGSWVTSRDGSDKLEPRTSTGMKMPGGTAGSLPSPLKQAPAVSRLCSFGPFGHDQLCRADTRPGYRVIHELRHAGTRIGPVFHHSSTDVDERDPSPRRANPGRGSPRARKRPKEPIDPLVRGRRCKHLRLGPIVSGPTSSPPMQAPASPLPVRHGPFGQDLMYGRAGHPGYGVIHQLRPSPDHSSGVVHGPSTFRA
jgi:hypothetical protein